MKHETNNAGCLRALQDLIDRSTESASEAVASSVAARDRQMSAEELLDFWQRTSLVAMTTVDPRGRPHSAPVHARLAGDRLSLVVYENTVRRRDLRTNPRVSFVSWDSDGAAVILYGRAHEVTGSLRPARAAAGGHPRSVVEIDVELTRVYAMLGRADQPTTAPPSQSA